MLKVNIEKFGEILNGRPKKMSYEEYRAKCKEQCLKLRGFNKNGVHIMGRLEGVLIPSSQWTNSRDVVVVIG